MAVFFQAGCMSVSLLGVVEENGCVRVAGLEDKGLVTARLDAPGVGSSQVVVVGACMRDEVSHVGLVIMEVSIHQHGVKISCVGAIQLLLEEGGEAFGYSLLVELIGPFQYLVWV